MPEFQPDNSLHFSPALEVAPALPTNVMFFGQLQSANQVDRKITQCTFKVVQGSKDKSSYCIQVHIENEKTPFAVKDRMFLTAEH